MPKWPLQPSWPIFRPAKRLCAYHTDTAPGRWIRWMYPNTTLLYSSCVVSWCSFLAADPHPIWRTLTFKVKARCQGPWYSRISPPNIDGSVSCLSVLAYTSTPLKLSIACPIYRYLLNFLYSTKSPCFPALSGIMKIASTRISYLKILSGVFHFAVTKISYMQLLLVIFFPNKKRYFFIVGGEFH